ncbi:MAG: 30S ribosome-binding factor RbfA [Gemmatimonadetes bacterium]|nr:30S ribosome-binding factor RbfA [Gemmatimonadota bacterium]
MPRDTRRPDRVAEAVREEIAALLAGGVKDPRVSALVTVTGVEMSRDLGHATVYVSVYGTDREREETMEGLDSVAPSLRGRVGRALRLRLAPSIHFKFDESFARATRIENLLASIKPAPDGVTPPPAAPNDAATEKDERGN